MVDAYDAFIGGRLGDKPPLQRTAERQNHRHRRAPLHRQAPEDLRLEEASRAKRSPNSATACRRRKSSPGSHKRKTLSLHERNRHRTRKPGGPAATDGSAHRSLHPGGGLRAEPREADARAAPAARRAEPGPHLRASPERPHRLHGQPAVHDQHGGGRLRHHSGGCHRSQPAPGAGVRRPPAAPCHRLRAGKRFPAHHAPHGPGERGGAAFFQGTRFCLVQHDPDAALLAPRGVEE